MGVREMKVCKFCGKNFGRQLLFAAMVEFGGAVVRDDFFECNKSPNKKHEFVEVE